MSDEMIYRCPLLRRDIDEAYCYEVNMVAFEIATKSFIEDDIDRKIAQDTCSQCPYRQL